MITKIRLRFDLNAISQYGNRRNYIITVYVYVYVYIYIYSINLIDLVEHSREIRITVSAPIYIYIFRRVA